MLIFSFLIIFYVGCFFYLCAFYFSNFFIFYFLLLFCMNYLVYVSFGDWFFFQSEGDFFAFMLKFGILFYFTFFRFWLTFYWFLPGRKARLKKEIDSSEKWNWFSRESSFYEKFCYFPFIYVISRTFWDRFSSWNDASSLPKRLIGVSGLNKHELIYFNLKKNFYTQNLIKNYFFVFWYNFFSSSLVYFYIFYFFSIKNHLDLFLNNFFLWMYSINPFDYLSLSFIQLNINRDYFFIKKNWLSIVQKSSLIPYCWVYWDNIEQEYPNLATFLV